MCSQQSILSAMDRFVKSVNNMNSTVLVPSKLRDMELPGSKTGCIPPALTTNTDLYSFFEMLNDARKELLWGPCTGVATTPTSATLHRLSSQNSTTSSVNGRLTPRDSMTPSSCVIATTTSRKTHERQRSEDSLRSLGSTASSSDPDTDSEVDSLMTDRDNQLPDDHTSHLATAFRHHLQGLHTILHQLADSADYLSSRYQEEIDASSL